MTAVLFKALFCACCSINIKIETKKKITSAKKAQLQLFYVTKILKLESKYGHVFTSAFLEKKGYKFLLTALNS